jgi:hypothetical protein
MTLEESDTLLKLIREELGNKAIKRMTDIQFAQHNNNVVNLKWNKVNDKNWQPGNILKF